MMRTPPCGGRFDFVFEEPGQLSALARRTCAAPSPRRNRDVPRRLRHRSHQRASSSANVRTSAQPSSASISPNVSSSARTSPRSRRCVGRRVFCSVDGRTRSGAAEPTREHQHAAAARPPSGISSAATPCHTARPVAVARRRPRCARGPKADPRKRVTARAPRRPPRPSLRSTVRPPLHDTPGTGRGAACRRRGSVPSIRSTNSSAPARWSSRASSATLLQQFLEVGERVEEVGFHGTHRASEIAAICSCGSS